MSEQRIEAKRARDRERIKRPEVKAKNTESCLKWQDKKRVELYGDLSLKGVGLGKGCFFMVRKCRCCGEVASLRREPPKAMVEMCRRCSAKGHSKRVKDAICVECGAAHLSAHVGARCQTCVGKYVKAAKQRRKAMERGARVGENVVADKVFALDGWRCRLCKCKVQKQYIYAPNAAELDHIIPLSKGGLHAYDNVQTLCRACNGKKSDSIVPTQLRMALV